MNVAAAAGVAALALGLGGWWAAGDAGDDRERREATAASAGPVEPPTAPAARSTPDARSTPAAPSAPAAPAAPSTPAAPAAPSAPAAPAAPSTPAAPATSAPSETAEPSADASSTKGSRARLTIPAIGVRSLPVVAYRGEPDDARGTRIQNRGVAASPGGPRGGVGPGQTGNYVVTGHRLSAGGPLRRLPELRNGDLVRVSSGDAVYVYAVTRTMRVSFRSEASKALQTTPVPGRPGREATRPMITLSTCATPEDRAAGNFWSDRFGNPEHRIDKVGVLVDVRPS